MKRQIQEVRNLIIYRFYSSLCWNKGSFFHFKNLGPNEKCKRSFYSVENFWSISSIMNTPFYLMSIELLYRKKMHFCHFKKFPEVTLVLFSQFVFSFSVFTLTENILVESELVLNSVGWMIIFSKKAYQRTFRRVMKMQPNIRDTSRRRFSLIILPYSYPIIIKEILFQ